MQPVSRFFGDRIGRRYLIWLSILGAAPFALLLPHVGLQATAVLIILIGLIISSAFPAILVYAQELMPGKVGMVAGLFFGFAFGISGIAYALPLGRRTVRLCPRVPGTHANAFTWLQHKSWVDDAEQRLLVGAAPAHRHPRAHEPDRRRAT